jgi:hypothetical protein
MPGFQPQPVASNVQTGNQVAVLLGDQIVYFAQTVGHQFPFGAEQLYGIGSALPQEIPQLRISPQISLDSFALTTQGEATLQSGVSLSYILAGNSFDFHVYDGLTNTVRFTYVGCKCQNFAGSIPTNTPSRNSYSFLAMDVLDSKGNSVLNTGENALSIATTAASAALAAGQIGAATGTNGFTG